MLDRAIQQLQQLKPEQQRLLAPPVYRPNVLNTAIPVETPVGSCIIACWVTMRPSLEIPLSHLYNNNNNTYFFL